MENKQLTEKESLELISRMIRNTQNRLEGNEGIPFLTWGYTTVIVTIAVAAALILTQNYYWNFLWFAIPCVGWPLTALFTRKNTEKGIVTYIDKIVNYIWLVLGISCFVTSALCIILGHVYINILFVVILLMASGVTLTGLVIKFKPLTISGIVGLAIAFIYVIIKAYVKESSMIVEMGVFAFAFVVMMIVPGHCLNCKARKMNKIGRDLKAQDAQNQEADHV